MQQWIRQCTLLIVGKGEALDVSQQRITFEIKKSQNESPNTAEIRVYSLEKNTENRMLSEGQRVVLQAGYKDNFGVIFDGDIVQLKKGREGGIETYVDILASDGDNAYNWAIVNTTLQAGSTQKDHTAVVQKSMGLGSTQNDSTSDKPLPRGKVMFGNSRDVMRQSAQSNGQNWSIQNGQLQIIKKNGLFNGQAVYLNSKSGLIGGAEQSSNGIKAKCLLNPMLHIGSKIIIDEQDVQLAKLESKSNDKAPANKPPSIAKDGAYKIISCGFKGDTYGNDWFTEIVCIDIDAVEQKKEG